MRPSRQTNVDCRDEGPIMRLGERALHASIHTLDIEPERERFNMQLYCIEKPQTTLSK